jgi:hypothetical protein
MATLHRALCSPRAQAAVKALNHLHTHAGQTFQLPRNFGTTLLGMRLYLRYNAPSALSRWTLLADLMSRAQVAYSLWRATTQPSYAVPTCSRNTRHELPSSAIA